MLQAFHVEVVDAQTCFQNLASIFKAILFVVVLEKLK